MLRPLTAKTGSMFGVILCRNNPVNHNNEADEAHAKIGNSKISDDRP